MDGYPDPEDEFEMMYAADMEAMDAMGDDDGPDDFDLGPGASKRAKKSLSFVNKQTKPSAPAEVEEEAETLLDSSITGIDDQSATPVQVAPEPSLQQIIQEEINQTYSSRKRKANTTAEDLFGDIEDIEVEDFYTSAFGVVDKEKERKDLELEEDVLLIARIREERQKILAESNLLPNNEKRSEAYNKHCSDYISDRVPRYPFVTMRNSNLDKYYLRLKSEDYLANEIASVKAKNSSLLPTSFNQTWKDAEILLEKMKKSRVVPQLAEDENMVDGEVLKNKPAVSEKLWVQKYQPKGYRDLLSDESTNKIVLRWLKMWDHVVFKTKMPEKKVVANPEPTFNVASKFPPKTLDQEYDSYNRPKQKIALLCGPPGLGKTTLAHVLAKHAGYNPVEVNASDDSSAESFKQILEASTQMHSVMGNNPRPNCLILDEIDGTPTASIEVLLKFILDKDLAKGKKKKGSKPQILKRPIICICNDLYVPALRQLRQQALIISFPPTAAPRLAQRLMEVSRKEHLKTDMGTLLMLCDKTGNDIRSCLSFLHFFKTQNKVVRLTDVQNSSVGQKDSQKGLFAVWHEMFQITKPKNSTANDISQRGRLFRTVRLIQSYGEYEFLSNGVYENYLHMKMKETGFKTITYGTDWFCCFDMLNTMIKQQQNYSLMPYLPYCFATWHLLYAGLAWPKINFPAKHIEAKNKTLQNVATLASVLKGMDPSIRSGVKGRELLTDTLPIMLHVINPNLKAVNAQLLNTEEKNELQRVVNIFLQFSLTFVQERTAAGEMLYRLEPNLPELVQFADVPPAPPMIYAVKQLVGHQVDSEKLRRMNIATGTHHVDVTPTRTEKEKSKAKVDKVLPNHLQTLSPQILRKGPLKPGLKNWLSISKPVQTASQVQEEKDYQRSGLSQIVFCYKEGYSNAVRKTIRISELQ